MINDAVTESAHKENPHIFMEQFIKDRNEALFSLDRKKIEAYLRKYNGSNSDHLPEKAFWAEVHRAICNIKDAPPELQEQSKKWLKKNGYSTGAFAARNKRARAEVER